MGKNEKLRSGNVEGFSECLDCVYPSTASHDLLKLQNLLNATKDEMKGCEKGAKGEAAKKRPNYQTRRVAARGFTPPNFLLLILCSNQRHTITPG